MALADVQFLERLQMEQTGHVVNLRLTEGQYRALKQISENEGCDISSMMSRAADMFVVTYGKDLERSQIEIKIDKMHEQTVKLLVSIMKLIGQCIYFSSLPVTSGPIKARLNEEGVSMHWQKSEDFAVDLLKMPVQMIKNRRG